MRNKKLKIPAFLAGGCFLAFFGYQFFGIYFSLANDENEFGEAMVEAEFKLDGKGRNVDTIAFWERSDEKKDKTYMFVTAKSNDRVEVWRYPFKNNERSSIKIDGNPNGVAVNQKTDELFVADSDNREIIVYSLPEREEIRRIGDGIIEPGETNLDIFYRTRNGKDKSWVYVTSDDYVYALDAESGELQYTIEPSPKSIETVLVDSKREIVYIPEEKGGEAKKPGIFAYKTNGEKKRRGFRNYFGSNAFSADAEGITMYKCLDNNDKDTGNGFIIVSDQVEHQTEFEFFDRRKWNHLGTLRIKDVGGTDGIAVIQKDLLGFDKGLFAAIDNDKSVAIVGWNKIFEVTGLKCD